MRVEECTRREGTKILYKYSKKYTMTTPYILIQNEKLKIVLQYKSYNNYYHTYQSNNDTQYLSTYKYMSMLCYENSVVLVEYMSVDFYLLVGRSVSTKRIFNFFYYSFLVSIYLPNIY